MLEAYLLEFCHRFDAKLDFKFSKILPSERHEHDHHSVHSNTVKLIQTVSVS
jgi:hypothetical protein